MSLQGIKSPFEAYKNVEQLTKPQGPQSGEKAQEGRGFGQILSDSIKEVDTLQKTADSQVENLMLGKGGTSPHEALIALEKADIAFQLMNSVRSKIIRAYEDVMRSQV